MRHSTDWDTLHQTLMHAVSELAERGVDETFNQAMALYPPRTLCEQLLLPLLAALDRRWQASSVRRWSGWATRLLR